MSNHTRKSSSKIALSLLDNNRLVRARSQSSTRYFCEVGNLFGTNQHKPRCKCNEGVCLQAKSWLEATPVFKSVVNIDGEYRLLPETRYPQVDYAYEIIDLQIYKKFSVVLSSMSGTDPTNP